MAYKQFIDLPEDVSLDGTEELAIQEAAGGAGSSKRVNLAAASAWALEEATAPAKGAPVSGDQILTRDSEASGDIKTVAIGALGDVIQPVGSNVRSGDAIPLVYSPSNYTPSGDILAGHLAGVDAALGAVDPEAVTRGQIQDWQIALLLHGWGVDASTDILDDSHNNHAVTAYGDAEIDTAQYVFNGSSIIFSGAGYLSIPSASAFNLGTGDFTVNLRVRISSLTPGNIGTLIYSTGTGNLRVRIRNEGAGYFVDVPHASLASSPGSVAPGSWYTLEVCRVSGVTTLRINGVTAVSGADAVTLAAGDIYIGASSAPGDYYSGHIAEIRLLNGRAAHTADYTPETAPYVGEIVEPSDLATPAAHASTHNDGGSDPVSGDALDIVYTPSNYTPSGDILAGHLAGLDAAIQQRFPLNRTVFADPSMAERDNVYDTPAEAAAAAFASQNNQVVANGSFSSGINITLPSGLSGVLRGAYPNSTGVKSTFQIDPKTEFIFFGGNCFTASSGGNFGVSDIAFLGLIDYKLIYTNGGTDAFYALILNRVKFVSGGMSGPGGFGYLSDDPNYVSNEFEAVDCIFDERAGDGRLQYLPYALISNLVRCTHLRNWRWSLNNTSGSSRTHTFIDCDIPATTGFFTETAGSDAVQLVLDGCRIEPGAIELISAATPGVITVYLRNGTYLNGNTVGANVTVIDQNNVPDFILRYGSESNPAWGDWALLQPAAGGEPKRVTRADLITGHASTHNDGGTDPVSGDALDIVYTPANYTPSGDILAGHLAGLDAALAAIAYTPSTSDDWAGNPVSVAEAINRIAAVVAAQHGAIG